jgi:hypothetical protein
MLSNLWSESLIEKCERYTSREHVVVVVVVVVVHKRNHSIPYMGKGEYVHFCNSLEFQKFDASAAHGRSESAPPMPARRRPRVPTQEVPDKTPRAPCMPALIIIITG